MAKSERETRTSRYLRSGRPSDGPAYVHPDTFADPTFVPRLSWKGTSKIEVADAADLWSGIGDAQDVAFYCDNSIFDDRTPPKTYEALFESDAELFITPRILSELTPWTDRRPEHPVTKAIATSRIEVVSASAWTEAERAALIHYVTLLTARKRMMRWGELEFERQHSRSPLPTDAQAVAGIVQKAVGERGFLFAKKGAQEQGGGGYSAADEELVYTAVAAALRTGRQSVLLTRDEDLLDQLYRLMYLIDSHYRSMLLARAYREDFTAFRTHPAPTAGPWAETFQGGSNVLVERDMELPHRVLPSQFTFVAVSCWLVGDFFQQLTFGAETEMQRLLELKGQTHGMNTDLLGARNCHLWIDVMPPPRPGMPACFAIAQDHTHDVDGQKIPHIELIQATLGSERFQPFVTTRVTVPKA